MRFAPLASTPAFFFVTALAGCATSSAEPTVAAHAELAAARCNNRQTIADGTPAERQAVLRELAVQNGPGWNTSNAVWAYGSVLSLVGREEASFGPAQEIEPSRAVEIAQTLVTRSFRTFGIRALETVGFTAERSFAYPRVPWVVSLQIPEACQPGFEGVEGACQRLFGAVFVRDDGTVHLVHVFGGNAIPLLTIDPTPAVPESAAAAAVVGQRLTRVRGPFENEPGSVVDYGEVEAVHVLPGVSRAIASTRLEGWNELSLELVQVVRVEKGLVEATFEIDACTGAILTKSVWGP